MKAVTFASMLAVSIIGTACSEKAPTDDAAAVETTVVETAETEAPQFNLRFPGSDAAPATEASSGFNLRTPDVAPTGPALRLPEGAVRENALSNIPEIQTPMVDGAADAAVEIDSDPDEDDIIRLD
ncbi:hypothetical protein [Henriciella litoralis]|uniref:hypothetical protein n=1 Tax=Henriciella litoralis TaxID=568102 RepID=UPI00111C44F5|nr:hypothetical protein [Henriciella litoralis]